MGVSKDATEEEIEKQYELWLLKHKSAQMTDSSNKLPVDLDTVTEAYRKIKDDQEQNKMKSEENGQTKHPFKEKVNHFWYYYKAHTILGLLFIFLIVFLINNVIENKRYQEDLVPAEINIIFFGSYPHLDLNAFEENIMVRFPEWDSVSIDLVDLSGEVTSHFGAAVHQRNIITHMEKDFDIYITDSQTMPEHHELFQPFEELETEVMLSVDESRLLYADFENGEEEHLYGIHMSDSPIFENAGLQNREMIITVSRDSVNVENTIKFIEEVTKP